MGSPDAPEPAPSVPAVVAAVLTTGGGGLEALLSDLAAQTYEALTVLVVAAGRERTGAVDAVDAVGAVADIATRVAAVAPRALVRERADAASRADAANDVLTTVEGAPFLFFVDDDVRVAPDVVRILVEEAYRSNAGIIGPKIVDRDDPRVLVDVGFAVDHYGERFDPIEPGELDQEQHDAVRDSFAVSGRVQLVRADLYANLHGYDAACGPVADADLAWRAHLAGARVIVAPDAVARAAPAPVTDPRAATAGRVRSLCKSYGAAALVWIVPIAFALTLVEAIVRLLQRKPRHARAVLQGWFDALRTGTLREARRATQAARAVDDREVRVLMARGSARVRRYFHRRVHAEAVFVTATERTRSVIDETSVAFRRNESWLVLALVVLCLVGARGILSGPPSVRGLATWDGPGALWRAYTGFRRSALMGADAAAPPILGVAAAWSVVVFGQADLARSLLLSATVPIGVLGVYHLCRPLGTVARGSSARGGSAWPALAAATAYAVNPVARNATAYGDLGALLTYAFAPFVVLLLLGPLRGDDAARDEPSWRPSRARLFGASLLTAVAASASPAAVLLPLLAGVVAVIAVGFGGTLRPALLTLRDAGAVTIGAVLLLLPWSATWLSGGAASLGAAPQRPPTVVELLTFRTGPNGAGWLWFGLLAAAALPLIAASGARARWAAWAWVLAAVAFALVFVPAHLAPGAARPAAELVLVPAALGLAIAAGAGIGAFLADVHGFVFGVRQLVTLALVGALALPTLAWLGDLGDGRYRAPDGTWRAALAFAAADRIDGGTGRVLWIGAPRVLPVEGVASGGGDDFGFALTRGPDARLAATLPATTDATAAIAAVLRDTRDARTVRAGHLLAPFGVRYVVVVERAAPGGPRAPSDLALQRALGTQLDLSSRSSATLRVYVNEAWFPVESRLATPLAIPAGRALRDPVGAILATDLTAAGPITATDATGPVLLAESYSGRRVARVGGQRQVAQRAFGVTDTFPGGPGPVRFGVDVPWWFRAALGAQVVAWIAAVVVICRPRRRRDADSVDSVDSVDSARPVGAPRGAQA